MIKEPGTDDQILGVCLTILRSVLTFSTTVLQCRSISQRSTLDRDGSSLKPSKHLLKTIRASQMKTIHSLFLLRVVSTDVDAVLAEV